MKKFQDHTQNNILTRIYDSNTRVIPQAPINSFNYKLDDFSKKHYCIKSYPLSIDNTKINSSLHSVISNRKSVEEFEVRARIDYETLCNILHYSYGWVNEEHVAVPSAGGKYPINIYLAIFNVNGLEQGLYYYNTSENSLELIRRGDFRSILEKLYLEERNVYLSSFIMFHVAELDKVCSKYGNRGYKLIHMDMGHLSQNIYLLSSAQNLGVRAIFGIYENKINTFLELNGDTEFVLLTHVFGGIKQATPVYVDTKLSDIFYMGEEIKDE